MKWLNKFTALNLGLLFALAFSVAGCGTSLGNLSPIQPVHNIAAALELQSKNPTDEVVVPAVPSEALAKPVLDKHGINTVGFRVGKARDANMEAVTYILAFSEYAHAEDQWGEFLNAIGRIPKLRLKGAAVKIGKLLTSSCCLTIRNCLRFNQDSRS